MAEKEYRGPFGKFVDKVQEVTSDIVSGGRNAIEKAGDAVMDAFTGTDKTLNGGEHSEVYNGVKKVADVLDAAEDKVAEGTGNAVNGAIDGTQEFVEGVEEGADKAASAAKKAVKDGVDKVQETASDLKEDAQKAVKDGINKAGEMVDSAVDTVKENAENLKEDAQKVVKSAASAAKEGLETAGKGLETAGKGLYQFAMNPSKTGKGLYQFMMNPSKTISNLVDGGKGIAQEVEKFVSEEKEKYFGNKDEVLGENRTYVDENGKLSEEFFDDFEHTFGKETRDVLESAQEQGLLTADDQNMIAAIAGNASSPTLAEKGAATLKCASYMDSAQKGADIDIELENGDVLSFEKNGENVDIFKNGEAIDKKDVVDAIAQNDVQRDGQQLEGLIQLMTEKNASGHEDLNVIQYTYQKMNGQLDK